MALELMIVADPCRGLAKHRFRVFGVQGGSIGRSPDSYWVLPDPNFYVSSHHCEVEFIDGEYWLRDSSRNGVFVNGSKEPIGSGRRVPLRPGDRIRVAEYEILARSNDRLVVPSSTTVLNGSERRISEIVHAKEPDEELARTSDSTGEHAAELAGVDVADTAAPVPSAGEPSGAGPRSAEAPAIDETRLGAPPPAEAAALRSLRAAAPAESTGEHRGGAASASAESQAPTPEPVRKPFRVATLDVATMERNRVLLGVPDHAAVRAYKILRTRLRRRMVANHWRSMAITGVGQGVGKTLTSINLALTFARDQRTPVFLVDLDLYRPTVASYLGMSFDKGLTEFLVGDATVDEIMYSTGVEGLVIIPNRRPVDQSSELLVSPRMAELAKFLENQTPKRMLLYDMPPLTLSDDVLVFSPRIDCVLDVVAVGVTERAALERSREILSELNVIGTALNRSTAQDDAGNYYYY